MQKAKNSRGYFTTRRRWKLRKEIREFITIVTFGLIGAVLLVSVWKGENEMTGLLVLIILLLIVLVIGMICMAALYYSLYKGFVALKETAEKTLPVQNDVIKAITNEMDSFLSIFRTLEEQSLDCYALTNKVLKDAEENKNFAMKTMRNVRLIENALIAVNRTTIEKERPFKFEEPEDNPDEPRS